MERATGAWGAKQEVRAAFAAPQLNDGAGDGVRTRDTELGKLVLYQLSYARSGRNGAVILGRCASRRQRAGVGTMLPRAQSVGGFKSDFSLRLNSELGTSLRSVSNPRHRAWEARTLPTELRPLWARRRGDIRSLRFPTSTGRRWDDAAARPARIGRSISGRGRSRRQCLGLAKPAHRDSAESRTPRRLWP